MKILHYIAYFSIYSETSTYDLITNLSKINHLENIVVTHNRINKYERPFKNVIEVKKFLRFHKRYLYKLLGLSFTKRTLKKILSLKPDIIHCHFGISGKAIYKILEDKSYSIPIIVTMRGTDTTSLPFIDKEYYEVLKKMFCSNNFFFTANSNFLRNKLIDLGANEKRVFKIYNTYNQNFFNHHKAIKFNQGDKLRIVAVGRLVNWKGHEYLVEAFSRLVKEIYEDAELTIIGEGDLRNHLMKLIEYQGISDKVKFLGKIEHKSLPLILQKHHIYVQPSIRDDKTRQEEAFGVSLLEAILVGLTVIATKTGGIPEVIGRGNQHAFLVQPQDSTEIYSILKDVALGKKQIINNYEFALEKANSFSIEKCRSGFLSLYKNVYEACPK